MVRQLASTEKLFTAISSSLSPKLLAKATHEQIQLVAALCPDAREYILECRLDEDDPRVDFSLFLEAHSALQRMRSDPTQHRRGDFWGLDSWAPIRDFSMRWLDPASTLHEKIEGIWLEFDLDGRPAEQQLPGVFTYTHGANEVVLKALIDPSIGLLNALLPSWAPELWEQVRHYILQLPPETQIVVGVMISRIPCHIRLYIPQINPVEVLPYLARIGRDQTKREVTALLDMFKDLSETVGLDVNVSPTSNETTSQIIGLEYITSRMTGGFVAMRRLLEHLMALGLCTPAKHDALLAWQGQSQIWLAHTLMPSAIERKISHCKIIVKPCGSLTAKAYLHYDLR